VEGTFGVLKANANPKMNFRKVMPLHVLCLSCFVTQLSALDRCVHNGNDEFLCTQDPLLVRERLDARSLDVGEHQRIEGSEEEKRNIREVLRQMDAYFNDEVLAMPEYEHVRFRW
jgi:hypothetical protein